MAKAVSKVKKSVSYLSDWSDTIRRIGDENRKKQDAFLAKAEADMPKEIKALPSKTDDELLDLFVQFQGGRSDPRETVLREKFAKAIRKVILKRMK